MNVVVIGGERYKYKSTSCGVRVKLLNNKKVLLCEHKRHTACHIASAHFADWGWGRPHPVLDRGYLIKSWMGGTPSSPG